MGFNLVTSSDVEDGIVVIGDELCSITADRKFARVCLVQLEDSDNEQDCYKTIKKVDYVKYHFFPEGYMIRTTSRSHKESVRVAKEKFPDIELICADAEEYVFEKKYDSVMIYNAFPYFPCPQKLIRNLAEALKAKGRLTVAHGLSKKELEKCHSTVAKDVSLPLPSKEKLCEIMSELFDMDVMISDEEKYIVSGLKKSPMQYTEFCSLMSRTVRRVK